MASVSEMRPGVFVGGQPTATDLAEFARAGIKTVVDLRHPAEVPVPNARLVAEAGLDYVNIPVRKDTISDRDVESLRATLADKRGPFFLHCATGGRVVALLVMDMAVEQGWSAERALQEALGRGLNPQLMPEITAFLVDYVARHQVRDAQHP